MARNESANESASRQEDGKEADPILLSLFANRCMSVAEAMGRSLQQTSISTNIKERLDFRRAHCFDSHNISDVTKLRRLCAKCAVRYQINLLEGDIDEGDVLMANHPAAGGSHLPDITIITPVFRDGEIVFFTASRGHHADIGGILPGSMPPTSKNLFEEGAQIKSFKIVKEGDYQRDELLRLLVDEPAKYPGCSGTRCLRDVESDLQAQIAANNKGVSLINKMIEEYGMDLVQEYMIHIRDNAELAVRNLLREVAKKAGTTELHALDHLDDGTAIELHITIDEEKGSAVFDFEGSGTEMIGNLNAPVSVATSAIIYCLRCMVDMDIPLNSGALAPITTKFPPGSILNPSDVAAVVGGNVCTSQRVTDVVLKAFNAVAASQGCCNNLTAGADTWGYYETIAGGSGAGPSWHGTSGVHTHMTNTRITDPEIFERRYPVLIHKFSLREGSGGSGAYRGGEGCIREIEFLEPIQCSILSERRAFRPFGLEGGGPGAAGRNTWIKRRRKEDGDILKELPSDQSQPPRRINLGGKATIEMGAGDRIEIATPGGGGWGRPEEGEGRHKEKGRPTDRGAARGSYHERKSAQEGV